MITTYELYEGLRDKMTPKPLDEVRKAMWRYFQKECKVTNPTEYVRDTGIYQPRETIYLVFDYDDHWEEVDGYFQSLIEKANSFEMTMYGDTYKCYPELKIVDYCDNTLTGGWYFNKEQIDPIIDHIIGTN